MKFVPPLISLCAFGCPHLGQTWMGASTIRCTCSHWCPHASQAYS
jgi:hypothetical protein